MGHSFVLSSAPFPSLSSLHSLLGLIGAECSCSGNRKERGRGRPHLSVGGREPGRGREGEHRALQLQQHRRRRPTCPSHRDNDENVLHRPIHTNNAEIQFLKEPRAAGGHLVLLGYYSPIQFCCGLHLLMEFVCFGRDDLKGIRKWARSDLGVGCGGGVDPS